MFIRFALVLVFFLSVSGKDCDLKLRHSLDFSLTFLHIADIKRYAEIQWFEHLLVVQATEG